MNPDETLLNDQRVLRPDEIAPGPQAALRRAMPMTAIGLRRMARAIRSRHRSSASKANIWSKMFGKDEPEAGSFTGEPPRTALTEPPPGYQTPSPDQPYGVGKEAAAPKADNYLEYARHRWTAARPTSRAAARRSACDIRACRRRYLARGASTQVARFENRAIETNNFPGRHRRPGRARDAIACRPSRRAPQIADFTLANGLELVVIPDHRAPVVTHMIWYKVGAADETPGKSGLAHFLEHLMFKGTAKNPTGRFSQVVATRRRPGKRLHLERLHRLLPARAERAAQRP